MQKLPSDDPKDPNFSRLKYVRYADDFLLGVIGNKENAEKVKEKVRNKLSEMNLTMSDEKTLITHARTQKARFLGFDVGITKHDNTRMQSVVTNGRRHRKRTATNTVKLRVPEEVVTEWTRKYTKKGKPIRLHVRTHLSDLEIIDLYGTELRGLANYYMPAGNVSKAIGKVTYFAQQSAIKTLAFKYKKKNGEIWRKYWQKTHTGKMALYAEIPKPKKPGEVYKTMCGEVSFQAGTFQTKVYDELWRPSYDSNELVKRLTAQSCELCGSEGKCEVHHIRKLNDLQKRWEGRKNKPDWIKLMIQRRRKTLVLCRECHTKVHAGKHDGHKIG